MPEIRILFIEDNYVDALTIRKTVGKLMPGCTCLMEDTIAGARHQLHIDTFDIVVTDYQLPDGNCFALINDLQGIPFIVITGAGNEDVAVRALKAGASDYLIKDANQTYLEILPLSVTNAIRHHRNEQALHTVLYERSIAGIFKVTPDGTLKDCNNTFAHILGYKTKEEMLSAGMWATHFPDASIQQLLRDIGEVGHITQYEWHLERADGTLVDVVSSITLIEDSEHQRYLEGSLIDVTRLNQAEQAHEASQKFITRLADATPSILYVYDLVEHRNIYSNREIVKLLGYSTEEIQKMGTVLMTNVLHPDDVNRIAMHHQYMKHAADTEVIEIEYRMRSANGKWRWLRSRDTPLNRADDGTVVQMVGVAQDVTDHVTALLERERYLSELQRSHSQLKQLARKVVNIQEEERHRLSQALHDEASQALAILKLELQQINSGTATDRHALMQHSISLVDETMQHIRNLAYMLRPPALDTMAFADVLEVYCQEIEARSDFHIELCVSPLTDLHDTLKITLYRILQEALTNVLKHANASHVRVQLQYDQGEILLAISDDGDGFDSEMIRQADDRSKRLGLLGIQERVESLNGKYRISSELGTGTRLVAHIPLETDQ